MKIILIIFTAFFVFLSKAQTPIDYAQFGFPNTYSNGFLINGFTAFASDTNGTSFSWTYDGVLEFQAFSRATNLLGWPEMFYGEWQNRTNYNYQQIYSPLDPNAFQLTQPILASSTISFYALNCNTNFPLVILSATALENPFETSLVVTNPTPRTLCVLTLSNPNPLQCFYLGYQAAPASSPVSPFPDLVRAFQFVTFTCGALLPLTLYLAIKRT